MIYDITSPITERIQVWPGDTPPAREVLLDMKRGDNVTLSTLRSSVHLGTHADAPSHYDAAGQTIEQRRLDYFLGPCQVMRVSIGRGERLTVDKLPGIIRAERV